MASARPPVIGIAVLVVLFVPAPALADSLPTPRTYKLDVPGGKYVFVMIPPAGREHKFWGEKAVAEMQEIRRVYGVSGLYPADGTTKPLWTVDWYADEVKVASDGVHTVRLGPWPMMASGSEPPTEKDLTAEAVTFFANGRPVRTYSIGELVDRPGRLPRTVSHFQWRDEAKFDDERMEYRLTTIDGNRFVFDVRTGEIVSQSRLARASSWGWWVVGGVAIVATVAGLRVWLSRRAGRQARSGHAGAEGGDR